MAKSTTKKAKNAAPLAFEATLWAAADALRGSMDAAEYKHVVLDPWITRLLASCNESRILATMREALLPKLLSGALRVTDAAQTIEGIAT